MKIIYLKTTCRFFENEIQCDYQKCKKTYEEINKTTCNMCWYLICSSKFYTTGNWSESLQKLQIFCKNGLTQDLYNHCRCNIIYQ